MRSITPITAREQITNGELEPIYLVLGDDAVEKAEMADAFEEVIDDGLRAFNVERLHGGETTLGHVTDATQMLPMMASRRVVIVHHAERCLAPKRETKGTASDQEAFETYLAEPAPHATLVLVSGDLDKRRRLTTRLLAAAVVVTCGVLETLADAERWVRRRVSEEGSTIQPSAAKLLAAAAGPNLTRLRGDVDRLLLFAAGQPSIGLDDVRAVAGPSTSHGDWAVTRAIERGQAAEALRELALLVESGAAPYMVLGQLAWLVRTKLPSHRLPAAVDALFQTDLKLKSSLGEHRVLLERLVMALCDVGEMPAAGSPGGRRS